MTDRLFETTDTGRTELAVSSVELLRKELEAGNLPVGPGQSVAAVLAMSSPPWHTATLNPFVREWVAAAPRDDSEREDPGPYLDDVQGSKATLQYKAHSYPTKVPPEVIVRLLLHYTKPGDVVLDGFAGSGMTGVAAQMCATRNPTIEIEFKKHGKTPQWGARRAVLNDLAPNATFLASGVTLPVDADAFDKASSRLLRRFDDELGWMYKTRTLDGVEADIDFTVWSEVFTCPHCASAVVYYEGAFVPKTGEVRDSFPCPSCGATVGKKKPAPALERRKTTIRILTGDVIERIELRPVRIHYRYRSGKNEIVGSKAPDEHDLAVLARVAGLAVPGAPAAPLPISKMVHGSRLAPKGFTAVEHLYSDRALVTLSRLWTWAKEEEDPALRRALKFWVEQAFWGLSWMNRYRPDGFSQVAQYQNGVYYVSSMSSECSPRYNLEGSRASRGKRATLTKLWRTVPRDADVRISTGDAARLPLDNASVDYIFVDPPFGANIPYSDLAQVIDGWHGVLTQVDREAIVDKARGKGNQEYAELMTACFREFARVLKPGRWMTVEFSNSSNEVWAALQEALSAAGFVVADTRVLDKSQNSYRQATAINAVKQDLMISCYKPAAATAEAVGSGGSSVWTFVGEHLKHLPIVEDAGARVRAVRERHPDRIYHRVVSYYVSAGLPVPMTASEFYAGLESHYNERDGMYFRPDQVETYERKKMTFKELAQTELFVTDEKSAVAWLRQQLKRKPQTMADIQPDYLKEITASGERPDQLPDLRELLEQNFIQDANGAWAVPDPRKVEHLEQLRNRDLLRTFDAYASGTGPLSRFRGEAVLAGFKKAWADNDYATIVKVAARLPQDYLVELPAVLAYVRNARARQNR